MKMSASVTVKSLKGVTTVNIGSESHLINAPDRKNFTVENGQSIEIVVKEDEVKTETEGE